VQGKGKPQRVAADATGTVRFTAPLDPGGITVTRK
jgi:hypothetical protein